MSFGELHILIIDDEEFIRGMLRRILEQIGVGKISEATDGADGLTKLSADPPDVVFLDIMMEPLNGLKFLKFVRTGLSSAPTDLPVIILTGSDQELIFGASMALDCNAFVRKPVPDQTVLKEKMARVMAEPVECQDQSTYLALKIPDVFPTTPIQKEETAVAPPPAKAHLIPIEEVEEGIVVARDVVTNAGEVLLPAGSTLSASYLNRLRDISEIIGLPSIWVYM